MDLNLMADEQIAPRIPLAAMADRAREETLRWFDELRDPLRRYLLCAGASPGDADEAVQESFLRLYRHLEKNRDQSNVRGWVFQVARNYLRDERKSAQRQRTVPLDEAIERACNFTDPAGSPEHSVLREERTQRLRDAVQKLPPRQRECMLLRSAGLPYREIADILGIDKSSVGGLVQRAMSRLSEELL